MQRFQLGISALLFLNSFRFISEIGITTTSLWIFLKFRGYFLLNSGSDLLLQLL